MQEYHGHQGKAFSDLFLQITVAKWLNRITIYTRILISLWSGTRDCFGAVLVTVDRILSKMREEVTERSRGYFRPSPFIHVLDQIRSKVRRGKAFMTLTRQLSVSKIQ